MADEVHEFDDELLSAYIDGELTDAERARVEARLEQDPAARQLLAELRDMSAALRAAPRQTLGRDLRKGVWQAVDKQDGADEPVTIPLQSVRGEHSRRGLVWAAAAIAAAVMLMLVVDNKDSERRGERTLAKSSRRESPRESVPTLSAAPAPAASGAVESEAVDAAKPAAGLATSEGAGRGGGGGYGAGREESSAGVELRGAASAPAAEALSSIDNGGLRSADQMVQLRLAQPRSFVRFQEVLAANSIQVEDDSLSDAREKDELAETPAEEDKSLMAAAAPNSSPTRADTLKAAQPQFDSSDAAKVDADVAAEAPGAALSDLANEADGATAAKAESKPKVQLGRARLAAKASDDNVSAVLVEATPSQIAAVLDAVRSDSLNFSSHAAESRAVGGRQNAAAPVPALQKSQSQLQGRALRFAVPRGLAEQADQKQLEEVVEGVVQRDRAGRQILNQLPRGQDWNMRANNTPANAEAQIRVLFLLDAAPATTD